MLKYKEYAESLLNEADLQQTKIEKIKLDITKELDKIKASKDALAKRTPAQKNVQMEIDSINLQSVSYAKISNLLKQLSVEMKKDLQIKNKTKTNPPTPII